MKKCLTIIFLILSFSAFGQNEKLSLWEAYKLSITGKLGNISVTTNYSDSKIMVDNNSVGNGVANVNLSPILFSGKCAKISAYKEGFYVKEVEFCPNDIAKIPKKIFLELEKDAAVDASVQTDIANVDLVISLKKSQDDSWKEINAILLNYIDAIETSDKSIFYVRTAWVAQNFNSGIVRTRMIIKPAGNNQLSIKIISELASPGSTVKDDEKFIAWDRVLRKYAPIIAELQSRM